MSTTVVLILKSLLPFLKEIFLKDKDLRAILMSNKTATMLTFCLAFVFVLVYYMAYIAEGALARIKQLEGLNKELGMMVAAKDTRITEMEEIKFTEGPRCRKNIPMDRAPPKSHPPTKPSKGVAIKQYALNKLKTIR